MSKYTKEEISKQLAQKASANVIDFIFDNIKEKKSRSVDLDAKEVLFFLLSKSQSYDSNTTRILESIKNLENKMLSEFKSVKSQLDEIERDLNNVYNLVDAVKRRQSNFVPEPELPDEY